MPGTTLDSPASTNVADASAEIGHVSPGGAAGPVRFDDRNEQRDLGAVRDTHRAEKILLEVPLGRRRTDVRAVGLEVAEDVPGADLHARERVFVDREAPRRHRGGAGAARLRICRRRAKKKRERRENGMQRDTEMALATATERRTWASHGR